MIQSYEKFEVPGNADTRPFNLNLRKSFSAAVCHNMGKNYETGFEPVKW